MFIQKLFFLEKRYNENSKLKKKIKFTHYYGICEQVDMAKNQTQQIHSISILATLYYLQAFHLKHHFVLVDWLLVQILFLLVQKTLTR